MTWGAAFMTVFACVWIGGVWIEKSRYTLAKWCVIFGAIGFFSGFILPGTKRTLDHFELPASFAESVIRAPDGGKYTASIWSLRVQRYDADGKFTNGWFPDTMGGLMQVGLTENGLVAVASMRKQHIEFFDKNGRRRGKALKVTDWPQNNNWLDPLKPGEVIVDTLRLVEPQEASPPPLTWIGLLLFPLWHIYLSITLMLFGFLFMVLERLEHQAKSPN